MISENIFVRISFIKMNPLTGEQLDYEDQDYGGSQKMQYHQDGAVLALADEEMIAEDDEYDGLYNDVNVGKGFLQIQRSEAQMPSGGARHSGFHVPKTFVPSTREAIASQEVNNARVSGVGNYTDTVQFQEQKSGVLVPGELPQGVYTAQRGSLPEMTHNSHAGRSGFQGSVPMTHKTVADQSNKLDKMVGGPTPLSNPNVSSSKVIAQIPPNSLNSSTNVNINRHSVHDEYFIRPAVRNGNTMLFVGELHWWTTDADLESVLIQYGKVKEIKFFDERASGKSKGYCQIEFYDPSAAAACKEGMNGHNFNGRACVVAFATLQTIKQMGSSYTNKTQSQLQSLQQGRNSVNDGAGRGNGSSYPPGEAGRNFGRGGWGRGGNQMPNKCPGLGPMRGRGSMGPKNMIGNSPVAAGGGAYGQGFTGPAFGAPPGLMHPQGMMGPSFDLAFMGRGGGYGGFPGPAFQGMLPPFATVNPMGFPGLAPHVNAASFGRGVAPSGMGMMGTSGMDGPHSGIWSEPNTGGWGGEEYGRVTGESSYGDEDNASEYGYGEATHDKGIRSGAASREKERNSECDWSSNPERNREERDHDGDRYDWDRRTREEKDHYRDIRHNDRDLGYDDHWDRGQSSGSRTRSRATPEENHSSRSRDADYGKKRRMPSE